MKDLYDREKVGYFYYDKEEKQCYVECGKIIILNCAPGYRKFSDNIDKIKDGNINKNYDVGQNFNYHHQYDC